MTTRRIVLTSGEPAGIGPDLCIDVAGRDHEFELVVAGDATLLASRAAALGRSITIETYQPSAPPAPHRAGTIKLLERPLEVPVQAGRVDPANARYVLSLLDAAADGCLHGEFAAMVTAPGAQGRHRRCRRPLHGPHRVPRRTARLPTAGDAARRGRPPRRPCDDSPAAARGP